MWSWHRAVPLPGFLRALGQLARGRRNHEPMSASPARFSCGYPRHAFGLINSYVRCRLFSELLIKEPGHDVQSFFRFGQLIVIPKGVGQRFKDHEFGIHAGAQESAMQIRSAAE
jgi:hypothetical protein